MFSRTRIAKAAAVATAASSWFPSYVAAQTSTSCNPLHGTCPADTALGMSIDVDFTQGNVNSFTESGGGSIEYGSDGATFTVTQGGDAPQLNSIFYIMFGRVEITMKAAPGAGIVSSFVLQSDCLDEIDWEWLGADNDEVQSNYFGKGQVTTYNRGQFHQFAGTQDDFHTYTIDWTADRIVWTADDTVLRQMAYDDAEPGQYPQTPMQLRFGAWSGGDSSNPPGTIDWARGPTDYSQGPFAMSVTNLKVTDYSTGDKYSYGDQSGEWQSIDSDGGEINGNLGGAGDLTTTSIAGNATPAPGTGPNVPAGINGSPAANPTEGLPEGWHMTSEGKLMPPSAASQGVEVPCILSIAAFSLAAMLGGTWQLWG